MQDALTTSLGEPCLILPEMATVLVCDRLGMILHHRFQQVNRGREF
ncbi:MAG: hypothetical protein SGI92_13655 [Bryobacteraceae bacterium]|nr:hypothetical protein [Bryobacteraceae bacterium]